MSDARDVVFDLEAELAAACARIEELERELAVTTLERDAADVRCAQVAAERDREIERLRGVLAVIMAAPDHAHGYASAALGFIPEFSPAASSPEPESEEK